MREVIETVVINRLTCGEASGEVGRLCKVIALQMLEDTVPRYKWHTERCFKQKTNSMYPGWTRQKRQWCVCLSLRDLIAIRRRTAAALTFEMPASRRATGPYLPSSRPPHAKHALCDCPSSSAPRSFDSPSVCPSCRCRSSKWSPASPPPPGTWSCSSSAPVAWRSASAQASSPEAGPRECCPRWWRCRWRRPRRRASSGPCRRRRRWRPGWCPDRQWNGQNGLLQWKWAIPLPGYLSPAKSQRGGVKECSPQSLVTRTSLAILPMTVLSPVAMTTPTPLPSTHDVEKKAMFFASSGIWWPASGDRDSGSASPVSDELSTFIPSHLRMRTSAGIRSPPLQSTTSPTTKRSAGTFCCLPSRMTSVSCYCEGSVFVLVKLSWWSFSENTCGIMFLNVSKSFPLLRCSLNDHRPVMKIVATRTIVNMYCQRNEPFRPLKTTSLLTTYVFWFFLQKVCRKTASRSKPKVKYHIRNKQKVCKTLKKMKLWYAPHDPGKASGKFWVLE